MFHIFYNTVLQLTKITENIISRHYSECADCRIISVKDIKRFVYDCFCKLGVSECNSETLSDALVQADYRGVFSQGVSRLEQYVEDVRSGICNPKAEPTVEEEFTSVAVVNGNCGFGPITGKFAMDIAMEKALGTGIGMVAAKGSNHFGMASLYTIQAVKKGYIGLSFSNNEPQMVPPGGQEVALGTNPLSLAAPAHCDALVVDMATTAVTLPTIGQYRRKKTKLPINWAPNKKGASEENPENAFALKKLFPLGGDQMHKGFGLALIVEVLSGVLADANCGPKIPIPKEKSPRQFPNLGHGFIAINPEKFVPNFATRMTKLLNQLRRIEPVDLKKPILIPGDKQRMHMKKVDCDGGICYQRAQLAVLEGISKKLGVEPLDIPAAFTQSTVKKKLK